MPDLLTHVAVTRLAATPVRRGELVLLALLGTALPDIVSKTQRSVIDAVPFAALPSHTVIGVLLLAYAASLFLAQPLRPVGFLALFVGGFLHLAVDMMKGMPGDGIPALFPLLNRGFQAGFFTSEDALYATPPALAILAVYAWRNRAR